MKSYNICAGEKYDCSLDEFSPPKFEQKETQCTPSPPPSPSPPPCEPCPPPSPSPPPCKPCPSDCSDKTLKLVKKIQNLRVGTDQDSAQCKHKNKSRCRAGSQDGGDSLCITGNKKKVIIGENYML